MPTRTQRPAEDRWRVSPEALRWRCDPGQFGFTTTADLDSAPIELIGQPRALESLRLGLALRGDGYNVFVAGEVGTGRSTVVKHVLSEMDRGSQAPRDLAYVHNFKNVDEPRLLTFPAGRAGSSPRGSTTSSRACARASRPSSIPTPTATSAPRSSKKPRPLTRRGSACSRRRSRRRGSSWCRSRSVSSCARRSPPSSRRTPSALDQLEALVEEGKFQRKEFERLKESHAKMTGSFEALGKLFREIELTLRHKLTDLDRTIARPAVKDVVGDLRGAHDDPEVRGWLDDVEQDILEHLDRFSEREEPAASGAERDKARAELSERMRPYHVNVVVDHCGTKARQVIWETSPSYRNLFGTIDGVRDVGGSPIPITGASGRELAARQRRASSSSTRWTRLEAGVWPALKRALRYRLPGDPPPRSVRVSGQRRCSRSRSGRRQGHPVGTRAPRPAVHARRGVQQDLQGQAELASRRRAARRSCRTTRGSSGQEVRDEKLRRSTAAGWRRWWRRRCAWRTTADGSRLGSPTSPTSSARRRTGRGRLRKASATNTSTARSGSARPPLLPEEELPK